MNTQMIADPHFYTSINFEPNLGVFRGITRRKIKYKSYKKLDYLCNGKKFNLIGLVVQKI